MQKAAASLRAHPSMSDSGHTELSAQCTGSSGVQQISAALLTSLLPRGSPQGRTPENLPSSHFPRHVTF